MRLEANTVPQRDKLGRSSANRASAARGLRWRQPLV